MWDLHLQHLLQFLVVHLLIRLQQVIIKVFLELLHHLIVLFLVEVPGIIIAPRLAVLSHRASVVVVLPVANQYLVNKQLLALAVVLLGSKLLVLSVEEVDQ